MVFLASEQSPIIPVASLPGSDLEVKTNGFAFELCLVDPRLFKASFVVFSRPLLELHVDEMDRTNKMAYVPHRGPLRR